MRLSRNTRLTLSRLNLNKGFPLPTGAWGCSYIPHARAEFYLQFYILGKKGLEGLVDLSVSQSTAQRGFYKFFPLAFLPNALRLCYEIRPPTGETTPLPNPTHDFLRPRLDKEITSPAPPG